jgi:hypothetical protein
MNFQKVFLLGFKITSIKINSLNHKGNVTEIALAQKFYCPSGRLYTKFKI